MEIAKGLEFRPLCMNTELIIIFDNEVQKRRTIHEEAPLDPHILQCLFAQRQNLPNKIAVATKLYVILFLQHLIGLAHRHI